MADYDVIVIGAGNAALAASVSAREAGAGRVVVVEKATRGSRGGNTFFSGGLLRFAFADVEELLEIVPEARDVPGFIDGVEPYPKEAFLADLMRMTEGRADPELADILISNSFDVVRWLANNGIKMERALSLGGVMVGNV
ncbi:MAG: FAD-binding protein, partial [Proteobacteria bacterium]|nr:FAD-binding protein [Pseudomonadota bacterium]